MAVETPNLFDHVYVAHNAPDTSRKAAKRALPRSGTDAGRVYSALKAAGPHGATDEELQTMLSMRPNTQRPRRVGLVQNGFVTDSGKRRLTATGNDSIVWCVVVED